MIILQRSVHHGHGISGGRDAVPWREPPSPRLLLREEYYGGASDLIPTGRRGRASPPSSPSPASGEGLPSGQDEGVANGGQELPQER